MSFEAVRYQVCFSGTSTLLHGDLVLPVGPGPHRIAVLVGGSGGLRDRGRWVETLAHYGLATLSWDSPGWGASPGTRHWQGPDERTMEVVAAVKFLHTVRDVSPEGVAIIGSDAGSWAAALGAGLSSQVAALVLLAPPCLGAQTQEMHRLVLRLHALGFIPAEVGLAQLVLGERIRLLAAGYDAAAVLRAEAPCRPAPWYPWLPGTTVPEVQAFASLADYHPTAVLPSVGCPVLAVFGADDPATPAWNNATVMQEAMAVSPGRDQQILVLPRTDDSFATGSAAAWGPARIPGDWHHDLVASVSDWLAARLGRYRPADYLTVVPRAG